MLHEEKDHQPYHRHFLEVDLAADFGIVLVQHPPWQQPFPSNCTHDNQIINYDESWSAISFTP